MTGPDTHATAQVSIDRLIGASPERVFRAWTDPTELRLWWGPTNVECIHAEVDLRVDGAYRLGNRTPSGETIWITGIFDVVEPPTRLRYSWTRDPSDLHATSRVTVTFTPEGDGTRVTVVHDRTAAAADRDLHAVGWQGCLAGLATHFDD